MEALIDHVSQVSNPRRPGGSWVTSTVGPALSGSASTLADRAEVSVREAAVDLLCGAARFAVVERDAEAQGKVRVAGHAEDEALAERDPPGLHVVERQLLRRVDPR